WHTGQPCQLQRGLPPWIVKQTHGVRKASRGGKSRSTRPKWPVASCPADDIMTLGRRCSRRSTDSFTRRAFAVIDREEPRPMCSKLKISLSPRKLTEALRHSFDDRFLVATTLIVLTLLAAGSISQAQAPPRGARKRPNAANKVPGAEVQPKAVFVKFPDWVSCVNFAPDRKTLAAGSYGVLKLLDVVEQQELAALPEPAGFIKAAAFSADGKTLVTGSYQSLLIWDVDARKVIKALKGHRGYVTALA